MPFLLKRFLILINKQHGKYSILWCLSAVVYYKRNGNIDEFFFVVVIFFLYIKLHGNFVKYNLLYITAGFPK